MNRNIDSFSFIPGPTSLYNIRVGELLKEDLGHIRQFQGKVMSWKDGMGSWQRYYLGIPYELRMKPDVSSNASTALRQSCGNQVGCEL